MQSYLKILRNVPWQAHQTFSYFDITYHLTVLKLTPHIIFDLPTHAPDSYLLIKNYMISQRKLSSTKIFKRYLLVAQKILNKLLIDTAPLSSTFHAINGQFICQPKKGKLLKWPYLGHWSKKFFLQIPFILKIWKPFDISKISS